MTTTDSQKHALRLMIDTHDGVRLNGNMAKALERRGFIEITRYGPRITDAGRREAQAK